MYYGDLHWELVKYHCHMAIYHLRKIYSKDKIIEIPTKPTEKHRRSKRNQEED